MTHPSLILKPNTEGRVAIGSIAPDFTLPDQTGSPVSLHDFHEKSHVILFFYPKDNTAVCTAEACSFRDSYAVFQDAGATVIGISSDSITSHSQFAASNRLPFTLLSDTEGAVRKRYGVPKTLGLLPGRVTYLIDRAGIVRHLFSSQLNADKHITEALKALHSLTS